MTTAKAALKLLDSLDRQSGEWSELIAHARAELRKSKQVVKFLEPTEDVVVTVEAIDRPGTVTLSLGFPFALASKPSKAVQQPTGEAFAIEIRRIGTQVDAFQLDLFDDAVQRSGRVLAWRETSSRLEFLTSASRVLGEARRLAVFADQFTYFGDAIQHRVEWDAFSPIVTALNSIATTCVPSLRGLLGFDQEDSLTALARVDPTDELGVLLVIPSWVDSHWQGIVDLTLAALKAHERSAVLVPGNNLIVTNDGRVVTVTHLARPHFRLSNLPVEQGMSVALEEFGQCDWPSFVAKRRERSGAILIAPFSSHFAKNLSARQLAPLVARLRAEGDERILLVSGDPRDPADAAQFERLRASLEGVDFISPDLSQAIDLIAEARVVVGADSSLAHVARRLDTPSVTIYNEPYWDGESVLGLLHRSVVGFGTANPMHHHLVASGNSYALTPRQCEAICWLAARASGDSELAPQTERACRDFAVIAREGDASQILEQHELLLRQAFVGGAEWLSADLPLRRLTRPFTQERGDDIARWLAQLTMAAKIGLVPRLR